MKTIETQDEFEAVICSDKAIIFITFDWSHQASLSEKVVVEWERTWNAWHHKLSVELFKLEPDAHPYTWEWLKGMPERGGGSVVWIKKGVVVDTEPYAAGAGLRDLARRTKTAFLEES